MLDAVAYRANETNAKRWIADWRLAKINDPYVFQRTGFPVRVESYLDLAQILDTMQEERFGHYVDELGGLTEIEARDFACVCADYIDFYLATFQHDTVIVPLSTMMAHYVLYRKLCGYNPNFRRLLEIGPGSGYLTFFLRHHQLLDDYSQIETTESFYFLQSLINSHVFGVTFTEHAVQESPSEVHNFYHPKLKWYSSYQYEKQTRIAVERNAICHHYPWWRIGDVANKKYDLITSNANLMEFSSEALLQYLSLIRDVLSPQGAVVAQCLGGGGPASGYPALLEQIKTAGFVPVAMVAGDQLPGRLFIVHNAVFIMRGHPLYDEYAAKRSDWPMLDRTLGFVNRMFFMNESGSGKRNWAEVEILDLIRAELAARTAASKVHEAVDKIQRSRRKAEIDRLEQTSESYATTAAAAVRDGRIAQLQGEIDALKRSLSWRATGPVRYASRIAGGLRIRRLVAAIIRRLGKKR